MLINFIGVIISQYICVRNHQVVHLKLTSKSIISIKLKKNVLSYNYPCLLSSHLSHLYNFFPPKYIPTETRFVYDLNRSHLMKPDCVHCQDSDRHHWLLPPREWTAYGVSCCRGDTVSNVHCCLSTPTWNHVLPLAEDINKSFLNWESQTKTYAPQSVG